MIQSPPIYDFKRSQLERWINHAITLLDEIDGDPDFEDTDEDFIDERENHERFLGGQGI